MTSANLSDIKMETTQLAHAASNSAEQKIIPGDIALWFFLMAELAVFGILILGFALVRHAEPEMFLAGLEQLHLSAGIINTMTLLTGSFLAALAVQRTRKGLPVGRFLIATALTGLVYVVVKSSEYIDLYQQGYSLHYDTFFGFYFFATFFHFLHVIAGMVILCLVANWLRQPSSTPDERTRAVENIASYWHMVDIVWIVLFPTLYLLK